MPSLLELKLRANQKVEQLGLPGEHHEDWLYTQLENISPEIPTAPARPGNHDGADVYLVNGHLVRGELMTLEHMPPTVISKILSLYEREAYDGFSSWNLSQCDTVQVVTAAGTMRLHHHVTTGRHAAHPRLAIIPPARSTTTLYLRLTAEPGESLTNLHLLLIAENNTKLNLVLEQDLAVTASSVVTLHAIAEKDARIEVTDLQLSGKVTRLTFLGELTGAGAHLALHGLLLGYDARHSDSTASIRHLSSHTTSKETYYSILNNASSSAFTGHIYVERNAQQVDAQQLNRSLLLGDAARAFSRPQLEINADDVKCSHGASVGRLDPTALFYLRSRGISQAEARQILIEAFAHEILAGIADLDIRKSVESNVKFHLQDVAHG